jgi:hypothetical protein
MQASFKAARKYSVQKIALNNTARRETTLSGRCFKELFGILFGHGALPTLRP